MSGVSRRGSGSRRRKVQSVPRHGPTRRTQPPAAEPINWEKYAKGTTGGAGDVPRECIAPSDTGSADDLWIRTMVLKPSIPEDIYVSPPSAPLQTEETPQVDEGTGARPCLG